MIHDERGEFCSAVDFYQFGGGLDVAFLGHSAGKACSGAEDCIEAFRDASTLTFVVFILVVSIELVFNKTVNFNFER